MHEQNIDTLSKEAVRLLTLENTLLQEMLGKEGVLTESKDNMRQTFDRKSALQQIEVLNGEKIKLDNLEMVLAVVGTMKAGKSTTINAIVGTEVLPNRNQPMTSLPTLIRHIKGQIEPVLKFENIAPISSLLDNIKHKAEKIGTAKRLSAILQEDDLKSLLQKIISGLKPKNRYEGAQGIFDFLKELNDVVRLARELEVDFPYSSYDEMHELPVIEVEFAHLRDVDNVGGCLTLLDTPGPNEAGQPQMRIMLRDQLKKASAVLTVLDYTQLKSEAEAEVREELNEIAEVSNGRLYVVVNKFDQKDRNGMKEDEVKRFIAENLLEDALSQDNVFPVSAKWGYLANRAQHELFHNKKLPDFNSNSWVADFGLTAMGTMWEDSIDNIEKVSDHAAALWKGSRFDAPLEKVIKHAHASAATLAVSAAAAKLVDTASRVENLLNTRETALKKTAKELEDQIHAIVADIKKIDACEHDAKQKSEKALHELHEACNVIIERIKEKTSSQLDKYFKEGKSLEGASHLNNKQNNKSNKKQIKNEAPKKDAAGFVDLSNLLKEAIASLSGKNQSVTVKDGYDFDPESPIVKLDSKEDANILIGRIEKSITALSLEAENNMKDAVGNMLLNFEQIFSCSIVSTVTKIVNSMEKRMDGDGFKIGISIPSPQSLKFSLSGKEMMADIIQERHRMVTRTREQDGVWGGTKRFFGWICRQDDWGHEDYKVRVDYFEIDMCQVATNIQSEMENFFKDVDAEIIKTVKKPLQINIQKFFDSVKKTMESIRGDLLQGKADGDLKKELQQRLLDDLKLLKKKVPGIRSDSSQLKSDIEQTHQIHESTLVVV